MYVKTHDVFVKKQKTIYAGQDSKTLTRILYIMDVSVNFLGSCGEGLGKQESVYDFSLSSQQHESDIRHL